MAQIAVYRLYDVDERLLYVGITGDVITRIASHAKVKPWFDHVVNIQIERFADRATANRAEGLAITTEHPVHNRRREGGVGLRRRQVPIRLNHDEVALLKQAAVTEGVTVTEYLRDAGIAKAKRAK